MEERFAEEVKRSDAEFGQGAAEQGDEEWAESRRLSLLRRRRLIAILALIGVVLLLVLSALTKLAAG